MTKTTTITEALAELKVIEKRIEQKAKFVGANVLRSASLKDPLEKQGGSFTVVRQEQQSISDLESLIVDIRRAIATANAETNIAINLEDGKTYTLSIADWLTWRREIAPRQRTFLSALQTGINNHRQTALRQGQKLVTNDNNAEPADIIVNLNEQELQQRLEDIETILGTLDGQLSLKNATVTITY